MSLHLRHVGHRTGITLLALDLFLCTSGAPWRPAQPFTGKDSLLGALVAGVIAPSCRNLRCLAGIGPIHLAVAVLSQGRLASLQA
jgi:hypothetical protein